MLNRGSAGNWRGENSELLLPDARSNGGGNETEDEAAEAFAKAKGGKGSSWGQKLAGPMACLVIFSFTSFTESVLRLLYCVDVNGVRVLYYAGAVECQASWQWAPELLLAILLGGPIYVVLVWEFRRRPLPPLEEPLQSLEQPSLQADTSRIRTNNSNNWLVWASVISAATTYAHSQDWPSTPVWQAVHTYQKAPFRDECMNWAAVLMLQRLFTVMCQSLLAEAISRCLGVTMVSFLFTLLQLYARPFHSSRVNTVQLAALTCLTFISMFSAAQTAFETAGVDVSKTGVLAAVVHRADWVMFLLLVFPPLLLCVLTVAAWDSCAVYLCEGDAGDGAANKAAWWMWGVQRIGRRGCWRC
jgi:hypothetical protein